MNSRFISENEIADLKKKRQDAWKKVRELADPIERPEEPYDSKSLFEKLQEQKQKKELEYEEAYKLKNMIKGLDDDEIEFLDFVDRTKLAADRMKELEEAKELDDFRNRVSLIQEKSVGDELHKNSSPSKLKRRPNSHVSQQQKLLKEAVITNKRKICEDESFNNGLMKNKAEGRVGIIKKSVAEVQVVVPQSALRCVGILPGLGCYAVSSDENSSDSEIEAFPSKIDLLGREMKKVQNEVK